MHRGSPVCQVFFNNCFPSIAADAAAMSLSVYQLVRLNLQDPTARNLMCLTRNAAALSLLFACKLLE